jgi:hypothetical protein
MKPCDGNHPRRRSPGKGEPYNESTDCYLCWAWENRADLRAIWEKTEPPRPPPACPHLWRRVRDQEGKIKKRWCDSG